MTDVSKTSAVNAGKSEKQDPEPKKTTPPEATNSSGPESSVSEPGPRKEKPAKRRGIEGSKRLVCKVCSHFLGEVKGKDYVALILCNRCKTENSFAFQELT